MAGAAAESRSGGYNLDGDGSCGLDAATDVPQGQAELRPLALVAPGRTATHALVTRGAGPHPAGRVRLRPGGGHGPARREPAPAGGWVLRYRGV